MREGSHENADTSFSELGVTKAARPPGRTATSLRPEHLPTPQRRRTLAQPAQAMTRHRHPMPQTRLPLPSSRHLVSTLLRINNLPTGQALVTTSSTTSTRRPTTSAPHQCDRFHTAGLLANERTSREVEFWWLRGPTAGTLLLTNTSKGHQPSKACVRAGVAQLVERDPSKVDVASSSLVSRCSSRRPPPWPVRAYRLNR